MLNPVITVMVKAARQGGNVLLRNINKLDSLNVVTALDYLSRMEGSTGRELTDLYTRMVGAQQ